MEIVKDTRIATRSCRKDAEIQCIYLPRLGVFNYEASSVYEMVENILPVN